MMSEARPSEPRAPRVATYATRVEQIIPLSPRVKGFALKFSDPNGFHFQAGQYVQALVPIDGKILRRPYSIASAPFSPDRIELCITHVQGGPASTFFHQLQGGEPLDVLGPIGRFTMPEELPRDVVFIATGSGIAPLRSMLRDRLRRGAARTLYVIFGNRYTEDILYKGEWEMLEKEHPHFHCLLTLSRAGAEWPGEKGYVQTKITPFVPNPLEKDYYICGLNKMIIDVQATLQSLGVPKEQIHYERYD